MINKNVLNLTFVWCISVTSANYLFPEYAVTFSHPQGSAKSYFGFTVQLQSSESGNSRLIVGAPRSNDSTHDNLLEPGAIFSCSLEEISGSSPKCEQFEFDSGKDEKFIKGKHNSCLGYSLDVNSDGRLVACAPKWINYKLTERPPLRMNGMCYYLKNSSNIQPKNTENLVPFNDAALQYEHRTYNYIFGQTGFSSQLIHNNETVIMTGVGLYNWTGSIIQYNPEQQYKNFTVTRPTKVKKLETYSYFGYSLASGNFNTSDPNKIFYVSGSPRSDNLTGMVNVYEQLVDYNTYSNRFVFPGQKFGEYFGASLAVADLNGDGIDDLIIGAPMHSTDDKDEIGRIYPYITQTSNPSLQFHKMNPEFLGERERGRFGTAISSLGDINKDGCNDIAVSAPYYDGGVVYIYLGQTSKSVLKLDQIIKASEYFPNMRGFGFSLSRGADIDRNYNNDLAIGSYLSDHAVVIKSRPVIRISHNLTSDIKQVDFKTKNFIIKYCLTYETKDIPGQLTIQSYFTVDNLQTNLKNKDVNKIYTKNNVQCIDLDAQINEGLNGSFKINARYDIINNAKAKEFCKNCPIDATVDNDKVYELTIPFIKGCGGRSCVPNLNITGNFIPGKPLVIGSTNQIELKIKIKNLGEHAFGVKFEMLFSPTSITLENNEIQCKLEHDRLKCNYNDLKEKEEIEKKFVFNVEYLSITEKKLNITLLVQSNSEDSDTSDNNYNLILPVTTDIKYNIISNSEPEQLKQYENATFVNLIHTYNIESVGQTALDNFNFFVYIPSEYNEKSIIRSIEIPGCENYKNEEINAIVTENTEVVEGTINLNCTSSQTKNFKCLKYSCEMRDKKTKLEIEVRFEVDVQMFREEGSSVYLVTSLETDSEYLNLKSYAKTYLIPDIKAANITMYIIIGIVIGILLILILGLILYKCKFFKKKTIPVPEEEPFLEQDENKKEEEQEKTTTVEINNGGTSFEEVDVTKPKEHK